MKSAIFTETMTVEIDEYYVIEWIKKNKNPQDVFGKDELEDWASDNGFIKEE